MARVRSSIFWILTGLLTALAAAGILTLQHRFDSADLRNATELVRSYEGSRGRSVEDIVRANHPEASMTWDSRIRSACFGYVTVRCRVVEPTRSVTYLWEVDMGRLAIHPANSPGRRVLVELDTDAENTS